MRHLHLILTCTFAVMTLAACTSVRQTISERPSTSQPIARVASEDNIASIPLDYTNASNWIRCDQVTKHRIDVFYIHPSVSSDSRDGVFTEVEDSSYRNKAAAAYAAQGTAFASFANVYAPYYRQLTFRETVKHGSPDALLSFMRKSRIQHDIEASLDIFFKRHNRWRPFILAGHGQGSAVLQLVLEDYMRKHPEYLRRMVAAYAIGFPFTKDWFMRNPHVKEARGEMDTGVVITWNTEGPDAKGSFFSVRNGICINPINWRRDETPASVEQNKGTLDLMTGKIEKGSADARIDRLRNTLVCSTHSEAYPQDDSGFFGDKSLHDLDYGLYYMNIRINALKRTLAFLTRKKGRIPLLLRR